MVYVGMDICYYGYAYVIFTHLSSMETNVPKQMVRLVGIGPTTPTVSR